MSNSFLAKPIALTILFSAVFTNSLSSRVVADCASGHISLSSTTDAEVSLSKYASAPFAATMDATSSDRATCLMSSSNKGEVKSSLELHAEALSVSLENEPDTTVITFREGGAAVLEDDMWTCMYDLYNPDTLFWSASDIDIAVPFGQIEELIIIPNPNFATVHYPDSTWKSNHAILQLTYDAPDNYYGQVDLALNGTIGNTFISTASFTSVDDPMTFHVEGIPNSFNDSLFDGSSVFLEDSGTEDTPYEITIEIENDADGGITQLSVDQISVDQTTGLSLLTPPYTWSTTPIESSSNGQTINLKYEITQPHFNGTSGFNLLLADSSGYSSTIQFVIDHEAINDSVIVNGGNETILELTEDSSQTFAITLYDQDGFDTTALSLSVQHPDTNLLINNVSVSLFAQNSPSAPLSNLATTSVPASVSYTHLTLPTILRV